ncbi:MAG: hypothetical protein IPK29_20390 [Betaproteobacteria bacterium]|nr:hypothetical protein [Betaproteobacteria bacterium]
MRDALHTLVSAGAHGASAGCAPAQLGWRRGEIVEVGGDCFGDAVNVAAAWSTMLARQPP